MPRETANKRFIVKNATRSRVIANDIRSADDSSTRRRGLLGVSNLDADSGLWINPCEAVHTFGMRVDLDIVFLDAGLLVRKITPSLKPNRVAFCLTACSVLEIRAGLAAESELQCGDQLLLYPGDEPRAPIEFSR